MTAPTTTTTAAVIHITDRLIGRARAAECTVCRPDYRCPPHQCRDAVDQIRRDLAACTAGLLVVAVHDVEAALAGGLTDLERLADGTMRRPLAGPIDSEGLDGDLLELARVRRTP